MTPERPSPTELRDIGAGLAFESRGCGPPLLLVHGLASSRRAWDAVAGTLSADFTVLAVDLPGHGDSPPLPDLPVAPADLATALGGFLDARGIDRAHLAGNSLGGWTVLEAAAAGRARSVVALAPAGLADPVTSPNPLLYVNHTAARVTAPIQPALLRIGPIRRAVMRSGVERPETIGHVTALAAARAQVQARGFRACLDGAIGGSFTRAAAIADDVPVTVVLGDRDRILGSPRRHDRRRAPAHARWEIWWRCGHAPMWDLPEPTARSIRDAAASAAPPTLDGVSTATPPLAGR